ncbi:MAG: hypothetical protein V4617_08105 [Gemmatimonadota bacterium]
MLMPNGSLIVAQPLEKLFRIFDSAGMYRATLGRSGKGPGEFQSLPAFGRVGDSLYAIDHRNRRLSLFRNASAPAVSISLPLLRVPAVEYAGLVAILPDGGAISSANATSLTAPTVQQLFLHSRDGRRTQSLATFRDDDYFTPIRVGTLKLQFPQPLVARPYVLYSSPSGSVASLRSVVPENGSIGAVELSWRSTSAAPVLQRVPVPIQAVREADVDSILDAFSAAMAPALTQTGGTISVAQLRAQTKSILVRKRVFPPVERVFMDDDGRVWLRIRGSVDWMIVTKGKTDVDRIRLPVHAEILAASGMTLWTRESDTDDLPVLTRYRLSKQQ